MRFKPGQSGNPAGRPVGSRNKRTIAAEKLLGENGAHFALLAIELAKLGHPATMRLCLDRICPRERCPAFRLPPVATAGDALKALNMLAQGVADGELTPAQAGTLSTRVLAAARGGRAELDPRVKGVKRSRQSARSSQE